MKLLQKLGILIVLVLLNISCNEGEIGKISINSDWKFKKLEASNVSEEGFELLTYNDTNWDPVSLPHTANVEPLLVNDQWQGTCWYRKVFKAPKDYDDKKVFLEFEAAMNHSKIWINGMEVAVHQGGYLPIVIDATKYIKPGEDNIVAVRLNNTDNLVTGPKPLAKLDFNMYGGLYRNAWLTIKDNVYISHPILADKVAGGGVFITYPKVSKEESHVKIKTHIINEDRASKNIQVVNKVVFNGSVVKETTSETTLIGSGKGIEIEEVMSIYNSKLWSPKNPNLYHLETTVLVDGKMVDKETNQFGIRVFEFKNNELYINKEKTFLRGVNRHQEYPYVGYALSDNAQYRDAKKIKDGGFDYIRLSHYPQSSAFMDACDELGLVVVDAIMGWQYYGDSDAFRNQCYKSATELIRRDRNRPSVLAWEVSLNETKMPVFFMEKLNAIVHAEYPGDNVYSCGWMDDVYDIYFQARQHRLMHPHELKDKPYSVSEYGDWEYYSNNAGLNQDKLPKNIRLIKSSRQLREFGEERLLQQAYNLQESHNDNFNTTAYSDSYWVMYDYNRGYYDNLEASGVMDIFRLPKFGYYFYKSQRDPSEEIVLNVATYWNEKSPTNVKVFSNVDKVKLFLNDNLIAEQAPDKDSISNNLGHPPFTFKVGVFKPGTLKAVGFINGNQVAESLLKTPLKPVGLKIWLDESGRSPQSNVNDVLFLYIAAVDENGTVIPDYSEEVLLNIGGDISIMNVEKIKTEAGIASVLIKIGKTAGKIKVQAVSGALKGETSFAVK
jgi:beta-galactosidase